METGTYDSSLEPERECCCSVGELYRAVGIGVVIGHGTEERWRLWIAG